MKSVFRFTSGAKIRAGRVGGGQGAIGLVILLGAVACSEEATTLPPSQGGDAGDSSLLDAGDAQAVEAMEETVVTLEDDVQVSFPAGSLRADVGIKVARWNETPAAPENFVFCSDGYIFTPHDTNLFSGKLAQVKIRVNCDKVQDLAVLRLNDEADTGPWQVVRQTLTADGGFVSFETPGFSVFRIAARVPPVNEVPTVLNAFLPAQTLFTRTIDAQAPSVSANGRFVAFTSSDSVVPGFSVARSTAESPSATTYVLDRQTQTFSAPLRLPNALLAPTTTSRISGDGRHIVFASATDDVAGDTNGRYDMIVAESATPGAPASFFLTTTAGSGGGPLVFLTRGSISDNGAVVGFANSLSYPAAGAGLRVRSSDKRGLSFANPFSVIGDPIAQSGSSGASAPELSADGRYLVFLASASSYQSAGIQFSITGADGVFVNALPPSLYRYDLMLNTVLRMVPPEPSGRLKSIVDVSTDGQSIVFVSEDASQSDQVYLWNVTANSFKLVSSTPQGTPGNGDSRNPQISDNGRTVVFDTRATNLGGSPAARTTSVYAYDVNENRLQLLSANGAGEAFNGASRAATIDAAGSVVVFQTSATNIAGAASPPENGDRTTLVVATRRP